MTLADNILKFQVVVGGIIENGSGRLMAASAELKQFCTWRLLHLRVAGRSVRLVRIT